MTRAAPETFAASYVAPPGTSIGHVHLRVADLDRALAFYAGVLGFTLQTRIGDEAAFLGAALPVAEGLADEQRPEVIYHHHIALNTWASRGGTPPPQGHTGLFHAALLYPSRPALAGAVRRVLEAGIALTGATDHGVSEAVYLDDPDGNGIELYRDRLPAEWPRGSDGSLQMRATRLDLQRLLDEEVASER